MRAELLGLLRVPPASVGKKQRSEKSNVAMSRIFAAVVMAFVLALGTAPARSSETATADDMARFLAGLPPPSNSPLAAYTKDPAWQQHSRYFDTIFAHEISAQLSKVREIFKEISGGSTRHDALHVQWARFSLRDLVFS